VADLRARPTVRPQKLALGVMSGAPFADAARARLCPPLATESAAELSNAILGDLLTALSLLPMGHRSVLCASEEESGALGSIVPPRWQVVPASTSRLEERLAKSLEHLFTTGAEGAAIVRGDIPMMPLDELFEGMLWLTKKRRLLLGATNLGGFYLVGTTQPEPALFEGVDWSSPGVVDRVRTRAEELGLEIDMLKPASELVDGNDLERLTRDLATQPTLWGMGASKTAAVLASAGFKP
jgi:uncharacterized protein